MAGEIIKVCMDRLPHKFAGGQGLAVQTEYLWQPGQPLRILFLDGDPSVQAKVIQFAKGWCQYANIQFVESTDPDAEIRISFLEKGQSWSLIGNDVLNHKDQPTMNFGWLDSTSTDDDYSSVVLHEFGHALGCIHEQASPAADIHWNKEAVYRYYAGPPNNWTPAKVDSNVFQKYSEQQTQFTKWDPHSIMQYPIDAAFTMDGVTVGWNTVLSDMDKQFIQSKYPPGS